MIRLLHAYDAYLTRKAWEAGRYGSLNELRSQFLPWMIPAGISIAVLAMFPNMARPVFFALMAMGFLPWFFGAAVVGIAFTKVAIARKRLKRTQGTADE
jgi:hypothetical protein